MRREVSVALSRIFVPDAEAASRMGLERLLHERGYEPRCEHDTFAAGAAMVAEAVGDAEVVCVALGLVDASAIKRASSLRLIVKCGIGVDNIDVEAARQNNIAVLRMGGINFHGVAEYVIGATIAYFRHIVSMDRAVRAGEWDVMRPDWVGRLPGLTNKVMGLLGVGSIGSHVATLAKAHGMRTIGFDPYVDPATAPRTGINLVSREELFAEADVLSIHAVLTDETHHAVGEDELKQMKPTAILVNTARGPIVDEAALIAALEARAIAGAVIDVFEKEPPKTDNPLLTLNNCILSPHVAGCTDYGYREIGELAADCVDRFLTGEPIPRRCVVVQPEDLRVSD